MASKPIPAQPTESLQEARCQAGTGLLLFDLDDTIVQAGSYVSDRVLEALRQAHEAGYVLSVASGRPLCSIDPKILEHAVMDYAVCANGATVTRLSDGAVLAHHPMSQQDSLDCYDMLRRYKPAYNAFFGSQAFFEWKGASYMLTGRTGAAARTSRYARRDDGLVRRLASLAWRAVRYAWRTLTNRRHRQVPSILPHLRRAQGGVDKMGCTIPDAQACAEAARMLREDGRFEVVSMGATELEITARGVTKGVGAAALIEALGLTAADAVAFGDGGNDLPLAGAVGCFVAMGNADDDVKAAATEVCPTVSEDGVAVWIEHNILA